MSRFGGVITFVTPLGNAAVENVRRIAVKNGHRYVMLVMDLDSRRILHVGEGRGADPLNGSWKKLGRRKKQIECAAADLSPAYTKAVREDLPNSVLVYDRFHIMQVLHRMITDCRRAIYRKLTDETARQAIKGSRFILLKRRSDLDPACSGTYRILGAANEPQFRVLARKRDQEIPTSHVLERIDIRSGQRAAVSCPGAEARSRSSDLARSGTHHILGAANEPRFRVLARKRNQKFLESA